MSDIHIDEFYHDCGKALTLLYNAFPRLITVYVDDLIKNSGTDEYGIPTRRHQACFDTLLWLADEGYIRFQDRIRQDALDQVVLTEKSFLRLSLPAKTETISSGLNKQTSHAWQLRKAVNNGSTKAINESMITFLTNPSSHSVKT